ncbi:hypothetical protein [Caulobacter sp. 17J80-11]|uniref:hypothetical protein n=1 Tax=Caulobacter sp. 17J80-11 TaxID=2763502 RepID=UPI0016538B5A|nr:hypothetical protein [Caulobacter sp. 17J80-11]MBC6982090.1 hypothetical protein [Caulobacter sp. 17J80-11]
MAGLIHRHDHHHHHVERERPKSTLIVAAVLSSIALVLFLIYGIPTIFEILRSVG